MSSGVEEIVLGIVIFLGIMAISALVFGGWVVVSVLKGIGNVVFGTQPKPVARPGINPQGKGVGGSVGSPSVQKMGFTGIKPLPPVDAKGGVPCQGPGCRQVNPTSARYCRRCGHPISQVTAAAQRRVAMW